MNLNAILSFAGVALWHVVTSWLLSNNIDDFLRFYNDLAMPVSSLYYLLFIIGTVSSFDRFAVAFAHVVRQ